MWRVREVVRETDSGVGIAVNSVAVVAVMAIVIDSVHVKLPRTLQW